MLEKTATFGPEFESVGRARGFIRRVLAEWGLEEAEPVASLLVTELATNSVLHARTVFRAILSFDGETLRIGVADGSVRRPTDKAHSTQATTGRGIPLVAAYSDSWGVDLVPGGKTVWCVLRRSQAPEQADDGGLDEETRRMVEELRASAAGERQTTRARDRHAGRTGDAVDLGRAA